MANQVIQVRCSSEGGKQHGFRLSSDGSIKETALFDTFGRSGSLQYKANDSWVTLSADADGRIVKLDPTSEYAFIASRAHAAGQGYGSAKHRNYKRSKAYHSGRQYLKEVSLSLQQKYGLEKPKFDGKMLPHLQEGDSDFTMGQILHARKEKELTKYMNPERVDDFLAVFTPQQWKLLNDLNKECNAELHSRFDVKESVKKLVVLTESKRMAKYKSRSYLYEEIWDLCGIDGELQIRPEEIDSDGESPTCGEPSLLRCLLPGKDLDVGQLYIGNLSDAEDRKRLKMRKISCIVTVRKEPATPIDNIKYHHVDIDDDGDVNIVPYFEEAFKFIHTARLKGSNVLVHCRAGISRSSAFCIAYIMAASKSTFSEAEKVVKAFHRSASPNRGFMNTLEVFEKDTGKQGLSFLRQILTNHFSQDRHSKDRMDVDCARCAEGLSRYERRNEQPC